MTRPISILPLLALTLTSACGLAPQDGDTAGTSSGGYTWGSAGTGSSSSGSDDTDSTADTGNTIGDTVTDTGSGTDTAATNCKVSAVVGIIPDTEWDPSVVSPVTANPQFNLWYVGNDTTGDYDGYGVASGSSTSSNGYITVAVEYCPGDVLVVGGDFNDGHQDRWLTEAHGVVNIFTDVENDNAKRVIVDLGDGNWQGYRVGGDSPDMGEAGWVDNGDNGGDLKVATFDDVETHDDSL